MIDVDAKELVNRLDVFGGNSQLTDCDALLEYVKRCVFVLNEKISLFDDTKRERWLANGTGEAILRHQVERVVGSM